MAFACGNGGDGFEAAPSASQPADDMEDVSESGVWTMSALFIIGVDV